MPEPAMHGGDGRAVAAGLGLPRDDVLDLSQSINPVAPDPTPVIHAHLEELRHYPDPSKATSQLADVIGVHPDHLLLTNGGSEAISLVAAELGGHVVEPEFSLLPRQLTKSNVSPLWRSNPNNPTGLLARADEDADVWDEAFFPLAAGRWTRGDPRSVVVGSLTKLLACPGLRVGYVLADPDLVERCRARQPTWSVNSLATGALGDLIAMVDLPKWSSEIATLRSDLVGVLNEHGFEPRPSDANWVIVHAPHMRERLAPFGIVVRDCANFGMPDFVRIAVPSAGDIERLDKALTLLHEGV